MLIKRKELANGSNFLSHFLLNCVASHNKKNPGFIERIHSHLVEKEEVEVTLNIDGEEVDFDETLEFYWSEIERMAKKQAVNLVADKFGDVEYVLNDLKEGIIRKMKEDLNLPEDYY